MKHKVLASLLALSMLLGLLPGAALAAEGDEDGETPVVCTQDADCAAETHDENCPKYAAPDPEADPADVPEENPTDVPGEPDVGPAEGEDDTTVTDPEQEDPAEEPTAAGQLAELIAALPDPENIDPENEEQVKAVYDQISAIYAFAGENGFDDIYDNETVNAVIAAAWPAEPLANEEALSITDEGGSLSSGEYELAEDVNLEEDLTIPADAVVTIDLKGHTLTGTSKSSVITVYGELTLKDSTAAGPQKIEVSELPEEVYTAEDGTFTAKTIKNSDGSYTTYYSVSGLDDEDNLTTAYYSYTSGAITGGIGQLDSYYDEAAEKVQTRYTGGGIYVAVGGSFFMTGGTITDNKVDRTTTGLVNGQEDEIYGIGGGVYVDGDVIEEAGGTFEMSGGAVSSNTSNGNGGGIGAAGSISIEDGAIVGNSAQNDTWGYGGGIYTSGKYSSTSMSGGSIESNSTRSSGGGICVAGGSFTMSGGTVASNTSSQFGGGISMWAANDTFKMTNGYVVNNTVGSSSTNTATAGGGIYVYIGTFELSGGYIDSNTIARGTGTCYGGGVGVSKGAFSMTGGKISNNHASTASNAHGGGICVITNSGFTMSGGSIESNDAVNEGGGIYVINSTVELNEGGQIKSNQSKLGGGISVFESGAVTVNGGSIAQNKATTGGGIYLNHATATLIMKDGEVGGTSENGNCAENGGGVFVNEGTFDLEGGTIAYNKATVYYGGGVCVNTNGAFKLTGGTIDHNTALINGGGIYLYAGDTPFEMSGGNVSNNSSGDASENKVGNGGGVTTNRAVTMTDGSITGNTIVGKNANGAGVYIPTGSFTMNGGSITNNSGATNGGGVAAWTNNAVFTMTDGTISGNSATNGGGIYSYGGSTGSSAINLTGGTITNNTATNGGGVNFGNNAILSVSGAPSITGNKKTNATTENNIYLADGKYITLSGELTGGAVIGVTTQTSLKEGSSAIRITATEENTNYYENAAQYFIPDAANVTARKNADKYIELAYDANAASQNKITFTRDGVGISGSAIVPASGGTVSKTLSAQAGYTLPSSIADEDITVAGGQRRPTCHIDYADGSNTSALLTVSNITADATITLRGVLKAPTVTPSNNVSKAYDGQDVTLSVTPSHEASGVTYTYQWSKGNDTITDETSASYTLTAPGVTSEDGDTYTCTVTATDGSGRTATATATITVTITAADIEDIEVTAYNGPYDSQSHSVEAEVPEGFQIQYSSAVNGTYEDAAPTYTDVGEHIVYWKVTPSNGGNSNYNTASGFVTVQITKATQSMSYAVSELAKQTGDTAFTNTLTKTIVFGDVTYTSNNESVATVDSNGEVTIKGVGSATITAKAASDGTNYDATTASYTLTVSAASDTPSPTPGNSGTSGGSHSSSGSSSASTYTVTVDSTKNGTVAASPKNAKKDDTVTLTVTPKDGYELDDLTVTDKNGKNIKVTEGKNGKFTFTMPAGKVTVEATFAKIAEQPKVAFVDVPTSAYYYDAVAWAVENGVTGGTTATTFSPNAPCTRAQAVTFLWRAAGSPAPKTTSNPFVDVPTSAYYYDAVLWAVENGITAGTSATTFNPDTTCTRAQIVTFLFRAGGADTTGANPFADVADSAYYAGAVAWAVSGGITTGTSATTFSPSAPCTRAQIVTFLYRAYVD